MIVELSFPAVIRAKPPKCTSQRQIICTMETMATFDVMDDSAFPVVAKLHHIGGAGEDVRHDGERFYRAICAVEEGRTSFPTWMRAENYLRGTYLKLLDDERHNSLERSDLTWPSKGRSGARPYVPFSDISGFELLDHDDVTRCEAEVARLTAGIKVHGGKLWIQCGEPCFRLRNTGHRGLTIDLSFADQDEGIDIEENYISATDPQRLRDQWEVVAYPKDREQGYSAGSIEIIAPSVFLTDFDDVGFMKYARTVASSIAYYFAADGWHNDARMLMATEPDDVDLWNRLRRSIRAMSDAATAVSADDDLVMQASELWKRLGGSHHAKSRYYSAETVGRWFDSVIRNWLDRRIELDAIVSQPPRYPSP